MDKAQKECAHESLMFQNGTYYVVCPVCRMTWTAGSGMADHDAGRVQPKHGGVFSACTPGKSESKEQEAVAPSSASTPIRVVSPVAVGSAELPK